MRLDGWFADVCRDELSKGCKLGFFFLGGLIERDQDIWIWGISSCVTSKFELSFEGFFFNWCSIKGAPTASVCSSFFVKNSESVSDWCWFFKDEMVVFYMGKSPL